MPETPSPLDDRGPHGADADEETSRFPAVVIGVLTLLLFIIAGLLLSRCGSTDEETSTSASTVAPTTTATPTTTAPTTTVAPTTTTTEAPVDEGALELEAVRAALDAEGFTDVEIARSEDGAIVLSGEVGSGVEQSRAGVVADRAALDDTSIRNTTTVPTPVLAEAVVELSGESGVRLSGTVPGEEERVSLVDAANDLVGEDNVEDALTISEEAVAGTVLIVRGEFDSRGGQRRVLGFGEALAGAIGAEWVDETERTVTGDLAELEGALNDLVEADPVLFNSGSSALTPEAVEILDRAVTVFADSEARVIEIGGHTDDQGGEAANQRLSEQRAAQVQAYLVGQGVAADRLTGTGYGEGQPVASNTTDEGRALNRRIEFRAVEEVG